MYRALTVTAECGAGRRVIAQQVAEALGWNLLDQALIEVVTRTTGLPLDTVARYDERVSPWWRRFHLAGLRATAIQAGVTDTVLFDEEAVVEATRRIIAREAWKGRCVIVGRGASSVLQDREEVAHVFVYGSWRDRLLRFHADSTPDRQSEEFVRSTDDERARYMRTWYGCDWKNPHLYDLMISSHMGTEAAANLIVNMVRRVSRARQVTARL